MTNGMPRAMTKQLKIKYTIKKSREKYTEISKNYYKDNKGLTEDYQYR